MSSDLLRSVWKRDNLSKAWRVIQENGRTSTSEQVRLDLEDFSQNSDKRLGSIQWRLSRGRFKFGAAKGIPIKKRDSSGKPTGKVRPIVLAPVESRIVQRALLNILLEMPGLNVYANTPYSFGGIRSEWRGKREGKKRSETPSAVSAAIKGVLDAIEAGGRFVACADISAFFTKVPKALVTDIIASVAQDDEFIAFLKTAIDVELSNLATLKSLSEEFPTEHLGVAQGNSLSPLLGNICLAEFDAVMNTGDCRCIRYIDDFIIIAPTEKAANARLRKAKELLSKMDMHLAEEKSHRGAVAISEGFDFLGINVTPGLIRPSAKARKRFLELVDRAADAAMTAFRGLANGLPLARSQTLLSTLRRIDGIVDGWGKHYWFCNDRQVMAKLDVEVSNKVRALLGAYRDARNSVREDQKAELLGLSQLARSNRDPFSYPSVK